MDDDDACFFVMNCMLQCGKVSRSDIVVIPEVQIQYLALREESPDLKLQHSRVRTERKIQRKR